MKILFILLLSAGLYSCDKKDAPAAPLPVYQFTATIDVTPGPETLDYDLFVTNDKNNRNDSFMIWAGRFKASDIKTQPFSFGFNFQIYICKDFIVTPGKSLYGATRERKWGNIYGKLNYSSSKIK